MSDIGVERRENNCGQSIRKTMVAVVCFYVVAGVLNGEANLHEAELLTYGTKRDICVALLKPAAWLGRVTYLSSLRSWLEKSVHKTGTP